MASLVEEVQRAAMDEKVSLSALLRKAKVLSAKLEITSISEWLNREISGYPGFIEIDKLPEYRVIHGRSIYHSPYNGICPISADDPKWAGVLAIAEVRDSIASIEENLKLGESSLFIPYPLHIEQLVQKQAGLMGMTPAVQLSRGALVALLEEVRTKVLDWSLELSKQGVVGEGMTFEREDKNKAAAATTVINQHTTTIHGDVTNSQLQQSSNKANQSQTNVDYEKAEWIVGKVKEHVEDFGLDGEIVVELNQYLDTVHESMRTGNPDQVLLISGFRSIRNILEGATGSVLASTYATEISALLGTFINLAA